MTNFPAK